MAETNSLLNCRTGYCTGGSNPPLSANKDKGVNFTFTPFCFCLRDGLVRTRRENKKGNGAAAFVRKVARTPPAGRGKTKLIPLSPQGPENRRTTRILCGFCFSRVGELVRQSVWKNKKHRQSRVDDGFWSSCQEAAGRPGKNGVNPSSLRQEHLINSALRLRGTKKGTYLSPF